MPNKSGRRQRFDYGVGGCYPDDFTCLQSAGICAYSNYNCAEQYSFLSTQLPGVSYNYYVWDPTTVASSYSWNSPTAATGGVDGSIVSLTDSPTNYCADAAGGFASALGGIAEAILGTPGSYSADVSAAVGDFQAGAIEGIVFAGIILTLPVEAVAALAVAVGITVVALFALLACHR